MASKSLAILLALGLLPFTASAANSSSNNIATPANSAAGNAPVFNQQLFSPVEEDAKYVYKQNPSAQQAHEFSVILYSAPANLEAISAKAHYINHDCAQGEAESKDENAALKTSIPVEFTRTSPTQYTGTLYADAMLDEDYLQNGKTCHWQWKGFDMVFEPKPNLSQIQYTAYIDVDQQVSEGVYKQDRYITRLNFNQPKEREKVLSAVAVADKDRFSAESKEQLVTISLEVKKK